MKVINIESFFCFSLPQKFVFLQEIRPTMETEKTYSYQQAYDATLDYFGGDELAAQVWVNKYALKDSYGNIYELTPDDMHRRIAREFARIEANYPSPMSEDEIFDLLKDFRYAVPQGSPMSAIGNLSYTHLTLPTNSLV